MSNYNSTARSLRDHSTPAQVDDNGYLEYVEFRNVVPRTREERRNMTDKETLEKSRLMKRRQGYFHYEDLGKITVPDKDAVGFISERERFQTDFASHEKQRREFIYSRKEANIVKVQEEMSKKEETRWKNIEQEFREEEDKMNALREEGVKAKGNKQSVPYDPITLKYQASLAGVKLKNEDDFVRYRSKLRSIALQERESFLDYNPITGEEKKSMKRPNKPMVWGDIKNAWEEEQRELQKERQALNAAMHFNS